LDFEVNFHQNVDHRRGADETAHIQLFTTLSVSGQAGMVVAQVALGITTLLMFVPTGIAATHQVLSLLPG
jgi:heme A synthase